MNQGTSRLLGFHEYHFVVLVENEKQATSIIQQGIYATIEQERIRKEWR